MKKKNDQTYMESEYQGRVPDETLKELSPEIRLQYFLWDEIFKREIELYPQMLLPLIKEIFGKEYPPQIQIKMRSTEYVVSKVREKGQRPIQSIHSDLLIQIGERDLYHIECQMKEGGNIAVRMLEYDINIAMVHGKEQRKYVTEKGRDKKYILNFPQSAILYLNNTKRTPDTESCIVSYPDGTKHEYYVPVLKVQEYSPEMIGDKHLSILLPFLPIRFKSRFDRIMTKKKHEKNPALYKKICEEMGNLKNELTKFIADCIMIINREEENGTLEYRAENDLVELMGKACDYMFKEEPELLREVHGIMKPIIRLMREELEEQIEEQREKLEQKLEQKDMQLEQKEAQLEEKDAQLEQKDVQLEEKDAQLEQKDVQLEQKDIQLEQHIQNYIQQCQEEGKDKNEVKQMLRKIFLFEQAEAEEKLQKYWADVN